MVAKEVNESELKKKLIDVYEFFLENPTNEINRKK